MVESFVYIGSIDDAVERCPFGMDSINNCERAEVTLLRHALFGGIMIVHEGYLVHNKSLRNIVSSKDNLVKDLIRNGRIVVLSSALTHTEDSPIRRDM